MSVAQQARRDRIVHSALELLGEREYERIQMRDVAERSQVALGTLYRYFPSKEHLFAEALLEWSRGFDDAVRRRRSRSATDDDADADADRLRLVLRGAAGAFERQPHFFGVINVLESSADPGAAAAFAEYSDGFRASLADALVETAAEDREVVATLVIALLWTLLRSWAQGRMSMRAVRDQLDRSVGVIFTAPRRTAVPTAPVPTGGPP